MAVPGWVFDLDGVLIDSEPIHMRAWREAVRRRGKTLGDKWLRIGIGMTDGKFWTLAAEALGLSPSDSSVLADKHAIFQEILDREGLPLVEGATELLACLQPRYPLAVATSSHRAFLEDVLQRNGWRSVFRIALSRDDVEHPKPDSEIYLKAAAGLGLHPSDCIAVEDSPTGLEAARAAGMRVVAVTTNFPAARLDKAGLIVDSLRDIDRILRFAYSIH
ncbi:MAG: HAD family phosphatase [Candidatus Sumerlaeota bacterium]|nr:HAD family phosphatase [Candidatus Sumerlaeota bacterium]